MKKKLLLFGLPVVLLLVAAFAVKTFVLGGGGPDEAALAKEPGPVYAMADPFVVNLADGGAVPRFAKVGVALRLSKLSAGEIVEGHGDGGPHVEDDAELRDIVIDTLQRRTTAQLGTPAGRAAVKREIVARVNEETHLKVLDVYYTEFAVQ
jgi:flagellar basal body-associated protein FliL